MKNLLRRRMAAAFSMVQVKLRFRWSDASKENRAIIHGASFVAIFLLAAKGIAAIKEMLVAQHYGASGLIDGYLFAYSLANWPISMFASVVSCVLVPVFVRQQADNAVNLKRFKFELLIVSLLLSGSLAALVYGFLPLLIVSDWVGLNGKAQAAAIQAVPFVAVMVPFGILAALYSAWLMSEKNYANAFLDGVPSLVIAVMLFFWPWEANLIPIEPILWGTVLGFIARAMWLFTLTRQDSKQIIFSTKFSPCWREMSADTAYVALAQFVIFSTLLVDQIMLARLPEGNLAAFGYAYRIILLILGLSVTALSRAMLPVLSGFGEVKGSWILASRWTWRVFWSGVFATFVLTLAAEPLVRILFERGEFLAKDTEAVALIFTIFILQLPFALAAAVKTQWFLSERKAARALFISTVVCATIKIGCGIGFLFFLKWGATGIALSYTVYNVFYFLILRKLFLEYGGING
jgi:putative peptidoglycan lipid II flippase